MTLRRIAPLPTLDDVARSTDFGPPPVTIDVDPTTLLVDEDYQRDLNRRSMVLIWRMVATFKWRKVKLPTVVRVAGGLHVIDGQHTAIAAATLGIKKLPCSLVSAGSELDRADAFVAHNRDRLAMTTFDVHRALVRAGDPGALAVAKACEAAKVRIVRVLNKMITPKVGDTAAVGLVRGLVGRRGHDGAVSVLSTLVKARRAPLSASEIAAVELAIFPNDDEERLSPKAVELAAAALGAEGVAACEGRAKVDGVTAKSVILAEYRRHASER